jgi:hypothetical protein
MVALRLAYSAPRSAPTLLPVVGRWLRQAWSLYWTAVKAYVADRDGIPRPPFHHY